MSTQGQQVYIHRLAQVLEPDAPAATRMVYDYCEQWYDADPSTKALSVDEASDMIQRLEAMIQRDPNISNTQQRKKIAKFGYLLGWSQKGIRKFMKRQTNGRKWDWNHLLFDEANKVITGMEKIIIEDGKKHLLTNRTNGDKK